MGQKERRTEKYRRSLRRGGKQVELVEVRGREGVEEKEEKKGGGR
jgi:hypothetical protein